MPAPPVPHADYSTGFKVGYQAIRGTSAAIPAAPARPATVSGMTPFLMGVRKGLESAGVTLP